MPDSGLTASPIAQDMQYTVAISTGSGDNGAVHAETIEIEITAWIPIIAKPIISASSARAACSGPTWVKGMPRLVDAHETAQAAGEDRGGENKASSPDIREPRPCLADDPLGALHHPAAPQGHRQGRSRAPPW